MGNIPVTTRQGQTGGDPEDNDPRIEKLLSETIRHGNVKWLGGGPAVTAHILRYLMSPTVINTEFPHYRKEMCYYRTLANQGIAQYLGQKHILLTMDKISYTATALAWMRKDMTNRKSGAIPIDREQPDGESVLEYCIRKVNESSEKELIDHITKICIGDGEDFTRGEDISAHLADRRYKQERVLTIENLQSIVDSDAYHTLTECGLHYITKYHKELGRMLVVRWRHLTNVAPGYFIMLNGVLHSLVPALDTMSVFAGLDSSDVEFLHQHDLKITDISESTTASYLEQRLAPLTDVQLWYLSGLSLREFRASPAVIQQLRTTLLTVNLQEWIADRLSDAQRELDNVPSFVKAVELHCDENVLGNRYDSYSLFDRYVIYNAAGTHMYYFTREEFKTLLEKKVNFHTREPLSSFDLTMLKDVIKCASKHKLPEARPLKEIWEQLLDKDAPHPFSLQSQSLVEWCEKHGGRTPLNNASSTARNDLNSMLQQTSQVFLNTSVNMLNDMIGTSSTMPGLSAMMMGMQLGMNDGPSRGGSSQDSNTEEPEFNPGSGPDLD